MSYLNDLIPSVIMMPVDIDQIKSFIIGSSLRTAKDIGHIVGGYTNRGNVSNPARPVETYRFINRVGSFKATLENVGTDAVVTLIRDANNNGLVDPGDIITTSYLTRTQDQAISLEGLGSGVYYLQVKKIGSGQADYTLDIQYRPGLTDDERESDNPLNRADVIDGNGRINLNGDRYFRGSLLYSKDDTTDIWRFKVDTPSRFFASVSDFQADLRLILLNDQSEILLFSSDPDKKLRAIGSRGIPAGMYYLKVVTFGPVRSTYHLTVSAAPISEAKMKALSEDVFDNA